VVPILSQLKPVNTCPFYFPKIYSDIILPSTASRSALMTTQTPIQWVPEALSLGLKLRWPEAEHSPLSSTWVKNVRSYTSIPQCVLMAWYFVKHRDKFSFTLPTPLTSKRSLSFTLSDKNVIWISFCWYTLVIMFWIFII